VITTRSGDVTVTVNAETKIDPSIKVGDVVHVIGNADASGQITAIAIYGKTPRPVEPPVRTLEGTVKSIGADSWVITTDQGDVTVTVNANTKIDPAVKVGDRVYVIVNAETGAMVAKAIYPVRPEPPPSDHSFEGTVKSTGSTSWVITTRRGDITVTINADTKIDPSIQVGDAVVVITRSGRADELIAVAIRKTGHKSRSTRG
jgi:small-conductance mechanosensitive channel